MAMSVAVRVELTLGNSKTCRLSKELELWITLPQSHE
jgi:hypothetical protein